MNTGTLAICDNDSEYVSRLANYIRNRHGTVFRVISFTRVEALKEYLKKESITIALISPELMFENIENENIENEIKSHGCGFLWKFQRTLNANKLTKG